MYDITEYISHTRRHSRKEAQKECCALFISVAVLNDGDHIDDSYNPMSLHCHLLYKDNINSNKYVCTLKNAGLFF